VLHTLWVYMTPRTTRSRRALTNRSSPALFREFVVGVTTFSKHRNIAGLFTNTTSLRPEESHTATQFSTITILSGTSTDVC
jgi:hypothetical protein